ncbi:MAG TPA: shikimate kinase [Acidimicrobiia bacterium]|nr:shikimate kinase [Acidimicrobiia bacterium]
MDDARHLVLVGMMGVGKSSVGRRIALRLGRQFLDTDKLVEEEAGRTVAEIFAADGEPAFRALEAAAVRRALDTQPYAVIAFGGGAVLDPISRGLARQLALVVWLQAPARDLARRVSASMRRSGGTARPLLTAGRPPEQVLDEIARQREDAYRATAHVLVDTSGRSPSQAATAVLIATGWAPE